jgi:dihydrofolate reductase
MSKTQYYVAASLDGFIADANGRLEWLFQWNGAEGVREHYDAFMSRVGALAMGAATYEFLVARDEPWPYGDLPTWVFTHRALPEISGANLLFTRADPSEAHAEMLTASGGRNVWLIGGGNLAAQFVTRGLLDELWLSVVPVVLGAGAPLLPAPLLRPLQLAQVTRFGGGLVELRYSLVRA